MKDDQIPDDAGGDATDSADAPRVRRHHRITGVVQGVGFRPFVHRLATELGLSGHVGNDTGGVFCEVEGAGWDVEAFSKRVTEDAPPLARIDSVQTTVMTATGEQRFAIVASRPQAGALTLVSADLAPCDACLAEMVDPADRRHRYPLLNCTNCGPRFTITRDVPYDRANTTMAGFVMCDDCRLEYDDPTDRRFHAQPTACPVCGPQLWLEEPVGRRCSAEPVIATKTLIDEGKIVAIKGVGGYHLACRADLDQAVQTLRDRKHRPDKPLAVMVTDLATARTIAQVSAAEAVLLQGPERPIVILRARPDAGLSTLVAPGPAAAEQGFVGVMLPPSPLHALLIEPGQVWVMTSGNRSSEPICTGDDEAREHLGDIAAAILGHDREIHVPCDDSVVRLVKAETETDAAGERPDHKQQILPIRRSRGYAPYPVPVTFPAGPSILAVGGELKATFCLRRDGHAFMSQHLGDMANLETLQAFERTVAHMTALFRTEPEVLACDTHPGYLSADWARRNAAGRPVIEVQHHHAHIASLLAEHRHDGPVIGFSFDGTGYGTDGAIWGGEILVADLAGFDRVGHLRPSLLAGGDAAVQRPYRQALARLNDAWIGWDDVLPPVAATTALEQNTLKTQLRQELGTVQTTSMGRLFDAVASLCGVRQVISYEGQAAIELEAMAGTDTLPIDGSYAIPIDEAGEWDTRRLIKAVADDVRNDVPVPAIAGKFHGGIVQAMVSAAAEVRKTHGLDVVGLSGGVFQNLVLTVGAARALAANGFTVLTHRMVPPNDGGLALGQAAVAATRLASGRTG